MVGEGGDRDAEVGDDVVGAGPEGAKVLAVGNEGEAGEPGRVEAGGADEHIDGVGGADVVDEAGGGDALDVGGEDGCVGCGEGLEVAWCWGGAAAAGVEVFGDNGGAESFVVIEFASHLLVGEVAGLFRFVGAFDDKLEALVELVFDHLAVFQVLFGIVTKVI